MGMAVLSGNYQNAIESLLAARTETFNAAEFEGAICLFHKALAEQAAGSWHEAQKLAWGAMRRTPLHMEVERSVLEQLAAGNDGRLNFEAAVKEIPPHYWMRCISLVQSFVWNFMASKRIEKYGKQVVVGDLVQLGEQQGAGKVTIVDC